MYSSWVFVSDADVQKLANCDSGPKIHMYSNNLRTRLNEKRKQTSLRSTGFFDNLVPLRFPMLSRVWTNFCLLWWWPKAPSNGSKTQKPTLPNICYDASGS